MVNGVWQLPHPRSGRFAPMPRALFLRSAEWRCSRLRAKAYDASAEFFIFAGAAIAVAESRSSRPQLDRPSPLVPGE